MSFARAIPERAYESREIRTEETQASKEEQLRTLIAYLLNAIDSKHRFPSQLEWDLEMTLACGVVRKRLRDGGLL